MNNYLSKISNLTIIIGIYLYFIAWIYVNAYYGHFGVSTASLKIDYSAYLVFSFNVLMSAKFLTALYLLAAIAGFRMIFLYTLTVAKGKTLTKLSSFIRENYLLAFIAGFGRKFRLLLILIFMVILFPWLFYVAQDSAWQDYTNERLNKGNLRSIQFVFRKDSNLQYPGIVLDSTSIAGKDLAQDMMLLKNDYARTLKLLGESDAYFIILNQHPPNPQLNSIPIGYVYFIPKTDVLLSKIILSSF